MTRTDTAAETTQAVSYENTGVPSVGAAYTSDEKQYTVTKVTPFYDENGTVSGYTMLCRVTDEEGSFLYTESSTVNFAKVTTSTFESTELEIRVSPAAIDVSVTLSDVYEGEDAEQNLKFWEFTDPQTYVSYPHPGNFLWKSYWTPEALTITEDGLYQFLDEEIFSDMLIYTRSFDYSGEDVAVYISRSAVAQFILRDKDNNAYYAYCMDLDTETEESVVYKLINLEDADYLTEDDIAHVRAVAKSGYWGVDSGEDEENPTVGSLAYVKMMLKTALADGTFTYDGLTEELVEDCMSAGLAMSATQAAIWKYANRNIDDTNSSILEPYVADSYLWHGGRLTSDQITVIRGLYNYLISQEPVEATGENTLLDASRITGATVTISDIIASGSSGSASAIISLILSEDLRTYQGNADIGIWETDDDGNKVGTSPIAVWNLFGGEEGSSAVAYSDDGKTVTIDGITLESGKTYMLSINGTQILSENVPAMFAAIDGTEYAQSMITMIGGSQYIDLYILLDILLEQEENIGITETTGYHEITEREWSSEWKTLQTKDTSSSEKSAQTKKSANVVNTGDESGWQVLLYLIAMALCLAVMIRAKRAA